MKKEKLRFIKNIIYTLLAALITFWLTLPALNITSLGFWLYIIFILIIYYILTLTSRLNQIIFNERQIKLPGSKILFIVFGIPLLIFIINICYSPMFQAKAYSNRISINENNNFTQDVLEVDLSSIPLLDKESSQRLGDRRMGDMADLVSQFNVSNLYTQINYNDEILRVTPLEYVDIIRWFNNRKDGVKGYITVNSVTGDANLIRLDEGNGMKYMPSAYFMENLNRHLRFKYPTTIFGTPTFEIDEAGTPYWIVPTIKYKAIGLIKEITGVVVVNPINGNTQKYYLDNIPNWIDHVHESSLIIEQINDWGTYKEGFWNSIFGQKNVVITTEGYNYLALNDDIYMYTGITSITSDSSILGFILTNLRTKETKFYSVVGAKETSAQASAEGLVQEMRYVATFPILINLNNKSTYLLSLKDSAGLVKMYALVDVADYQQVTATDVKDGIETTIRRYLESYDTSENIETNEEKAIEIKNITTAVMDGNTYYYIIDQDDIKYQVSIKVSPSHLPFLKVGNKININYGLNGSIFVITNITIK